MADDPNKKTEKERQDPSNPIDQNEREPYREPKRPFDPQIEHEIEPERSETRSSFADLLFP